jgi:hypothetical protein
MKTDGTPSIEDILEQIELLQEFEKIELLKRIGRGGINTIYGRYNFPMHTYR